jgi:hypothetical protein
MSLGAACGIVEVGEDLVDHHRIFDAGDDLDGTAATLADVGVDVENALQALFPR